MCGPVQARGEVAQKRLAPPAHVLRAGMLTLGRASARIDSCGARASVAATTSRSSSNVAASVRMLLIGMSRSCAITRPPSFAVELHAILAPGGLMVSRPHRAFMRHATDDPTVVESLTLIAPPPALLARAVGVGVFDDPGTRRFPVWNVLRPWLGTLSSR